MQIKLIPIFALLITLPSLALAEIQSKSWAQKAKEIVTNKKVIAGVVIGLAAVIGITGTVFGYRSWTRKEDERKAIELYETNNYGEVRQKVSPQEHQLLYNELLPTLKDLHIDQYAIDFFKAELNPSSRTRISKGFEYLILERVIRAEPTPSDNPDDFNNKKLIVVQKLVDAGVYPNGPIGSGFGTILRLVINTKQNNIAKYLINKGALKFENNVSEGRGAVIAGAIGLMNWDMITYMLTQGLKIDNWGKLFNQTFAPYGDEIYPSSKKDQMIAGLRTMPNIEDEKGVPLYDAISQYEKQEEEGSLR